MIDTIEPERLNFNEEFENDRRFDWMIHTIQPMWFLRCIFTRTTAILWRNRNETAACAMSKRIISQSSKFIERCAMIRSNRLWRVLVEDPHLIDKSCWMVEQQVCIVSWSTNRPFHLLPDTFEQHCDRKPLKQYASAPHPNDLTEFASNRKRSLVDKCCWIIQKSTCHSHMWLFGATVR